MVLEYDGTDYHGWQVQPELITVQGSLEGALATILGERVRIEVAGRTDAGVHARGQVAAFSTVRAADCARLQRGLNALCGPGIVARQVGPVADDFDPRRDARSRRYEYRIHNAPWPSPFTRRHAWHVHRPLDAAAMTEAAAVLVGEHDFSSFQAADCDAENPGSAGLGEHLRDGGRRGRLPRRSDCLSTPHGTERRGDAGRGGNGGAGARPVSSRCWRPATLPEPRHGSGT